MSMYRLGGAIALALTFVAPASAQTINVTGQEPLGAEVKRVQVGFGDLDLDRTADQERMGRRIRLAAKQVCGSTPRRGLEKRVDHARCVTAAKDGAAGQLRGLMPTMVAGGG